MDGVGFDADLHPNFTQSGGPISFGFIRLNNSSAGITTDTGIDNWTFTVHFIVCGGPDTDGDGFPDNCDNCPAVPNPGQNDCDNDSVGNDCDSDGDNDDVPNPSDVCPLAPCNSPHVHADGRLKGDLYEDCRIDLVDFATFAMHFGV